MLKWALCFIAVGSIPALAASQSAEERLSQIENYCLKNNSSAQYRSCMDDRAKNIDKELVAAVRKRHFDIREVEMQEKNMSVDHLAGKEDAKKWKNSFDTEQSLFASYRKLKCDNVLNFENAGGSNAGGAASKCYIRLTLQRIYDLDVGF